MKTKIILGPPGTGKTHTLLNRVEEELARGTPPDRIAFLAFTKKAATEARDRAMKKFKLEEHVVWINEYVPDNKVNLYFSACDLVVLPYKKASQSGIIPIAYNYNKIILASDTDGLKEFIYEGKNGYLFESLNHASLFDKLKFILSNHDYSKSDMFINKFKKQFSIEKLEEDIISTLD